VRVRTLFSSSEDGSYVILTRGQNLWERVWRTRLRRADEGAADPCWRDPFATLRKKWSELPTDVSRVQASRLNELGDEELIGFWDAARNAATMGECFHRRGWYHLLYAPLLKNARLIDFGSGLGLDGLTFAPQASRVTFIDIVPANLELLQRIARLKRLSNVDFLYLETFESLKAVDNGYDVVIASGSLHHAPASITRVEIRELAPHLRIGGRWLQLAYPKCRWERDGGMPFSEWGTITDGTSTPWCEWYDLEKLLPMFEPLEFDVVLAFNFHHDDFNWFDLVRTS
jgi:2-polyprenyl-3-methyl-5-hydroxy-6-metoxy-1,4-benzoquinol methylase